MREALQYKEQLVKNLQHSQFLSQQHLNSALDGCQSQIQSLQRELHEKNSQLEDLTARVADLEYILSTYEASDESSSSGGDIDSVCSPTHLGESHSSGSDIDESQQEVLTEQADVIDHITTRQQELSEGGQPATSLCESNDGSDELLQSCTQKEGTSLSAIENTSSLQTELDFLKVENESLKELLRMYEAEAKARFALDEFF